MSVNSLDEVVANELNKRSVAANEKLIRKMIEEAKEGYIQSALAAVKGNYDTAQKWGNGALKLLETLESLHCGSVGGYDEGQDEEDRTFVGRLKWISKAILNEHLVMAPVYMKLQIGNKLLNHEFMKGMGKSSPKVIIDTNNN